MGKEANLWQLVKRQFDIFPKCTLTRIENRDTGPGVADVHVIDNGKEYWLELKQAEYPSSKETVIFKRGGLRPSQIQWITRHTMCGGNAWVIARVGGLIFLVNASYANEFNSWTLTNLEQKASRSFHYLDTAEWCLTRGFIMRSCHA